jgi:translation initiation factor 4A
MDDIRRLQQGVVVATGCPGRVMDLIRRGALRTEHLRVLVLDEADDMLSQGFADQIYEIFRYLPRDIQIALFSATLPDDVLELSKKFLRDPTRILVKKESLTLKAIKQFYVAVEDEHKLEILVDLYETISIAQSVIFANTKRAVDMITDYLSRQHHTVTSMHGDMTKADRDRVMAKFRAGDARVLITTDLVARGIDVQHVNIVINFDIPDNRENYLHRIGRSGRYGRKGVAINLVTPRDVDALRDIQRHFATHIDELPMDFADHLGE